MVSLEPNPLQWGEVAPLGYSEWTGCRLNCGKACTNRGDGATSFCRLSDCRKGCLKRASRTTVYDLVLFDAFAPAAQPELWTSGPWTSMRMVLKPGGQLVTYCAKGDVRRAMETAGFQVERLLDLPASGR